MREKSASGAGDRSPWVGWRGQIPRSRTRGWRTRCLLDASASRDSAQLACDLRMGVLQCPIQWLDTQWIGMHFIQCSCGSLRFAQELIDPWQIVLAGFSLFATTKFAHSRNPLVICGTEHGKTHLYGVGPSFSPFSSENRCAPMCVRRWGRHKPAHIAALGFDARTCEPSR
jgi:hypothetical protein